jgi:excisionase family DNA binding protein
MHTSTYSSVGSLLGQDLKRGTMSALIMTEEKIYTVKEVADKLRVTPRTVRRMIVDGELPAFKVRDEYRIRQQALEALIQSQDREQEKE